ncbi:NYN domain-containing protein [Zoogloea sp.]|uniref:NYN domain-containing protein n=1 Tax=Zoogloea sp. TaxID=49181 RepID=UPI002626BBD9|nr:NYN domain-containing protein [Zoogloea sp.]MDD3352951.1 NYN domain-containing protein [Zoogloea sp.]
MASSPDNVSMALFCDFENVALGVRDAKFEKFDIKLVLERLLLKGSIVVKKAYCDWDRYKGFKAAMHEANFELIEIPHVRQSGKNSADIRLVVDALDLCYTKSHVDTFVIISGDSDFSPLVSKLRENAKQVIGVGVKQSTSDLLVANCDEFIFYDDLVRETRQTAAKREPRETQQAQRRTPEEEKRRREEQDARRSRAVDIVAETFEALLAERGDTGKIWASVLKEAVKRRKPDFSETRYGFKAFGNLLDEAQTRGFLEVGRDDKSGTFVMRSAQVRGENRAEGAFPLETLPALEVPVQEVLASDEGDNRRGSRRRNGRKSRVDAALPQEQPGLSLPETEGEVSVPEPMDMPVVALLPGNEKREDPVESGDTGAVKKPRKRSRKTEAPVESVPSAEVRTEAVPEPRKRSPRKKVEVREGSADAEPVETAAVEPPKTGRRRSRKVAS